MRSRRLVLSALLGALLAIGQLGVLVHGLLHVVGSEPSADQLQSGATHDHDRHAPQACNAFDGLIGASACGTGFVLAAPPLVAPAAAQYYLRTVSSEVGYSSRAPPFPAART